jgi:hypothetical protein
MIRALAAACLLACPPAEALTIEIRYELAGSAFFDQPGAKEALRAAADFYEDLISDQLGAIDPAQYPGSSWIPTHADPLTGLPVNMVAQTNLVVPPDTIIIYAGSMNLGTATARAGAGGVVLNVGGPLAWWNQLIGRGETGASQIVGGAYTLNPTDFAPWGGVIFFNSAVANWNFSTTDATGTAGPDALSVALHEIGHILGLGTYRADCSWTTRINPANGHFTGPLATQSFASNPPTDAVHLLPGSTKSGAYGCFGVAHGSLLKPLMSAALPASNNFYVPTDVDLAMLRDIGWELAIPERAASVSTGAAATLAVPTTTGFNYEVRRSTDLASWGDPVAVLQGNGLAMTWVDPAASPKAFYRVNRLTDAVAAAAPVTGKSVDDSSAAILAPPAAPSPVMCACGEIH